MFLLHKRIFPSCSTKQPTTCHRPVRQNSKTRNTLAGPQVCHKDSKASRFQGRVLCSLILPLSQLKGPISPFLFVRKTKNKVECACHNLLECRFFECKCHNRSDIIYSQSVRNLKTIHQESGEQMSQFRYLKYDLFSWCTKFKVINSFHTVPT